MIGGLNQPKKPELHPRPVPKLVDVQGPGYIVGHVARDPCTDFDIKIMQYNQRRAEFQERVVQSLRKDIADDKYNMKFMLHSEKRGFNRDINKRVEAKMIEYEENVESRRKKLLDLFGREEREFVKETVESIQQGDNYKMQEMKLRLEELKARREEERTELAKQKKLQQLLNNCQEFRPLIAKIHLHEAKAGQKQQMLENEMRRESELELHRMWHNMLLKEMEAQEERAQQDRLAFRKRMLENTSTWARQVQEKKIQEQLLEREKREDFIKLEQIKEELLREEIRNLDEKRRRRDELLSEISAEIKKRKEIIKKREEEEISVVRAYEKAVAEEIEKDKIKARATMEVARKEMMQFLDYITKLEQERIEEEKILDQLVEQSRKNIEEKKTDVKCKFEYARQALQEATMKGRADQIEYKRKLAEEQLKKKQLENELIRMNIEQNERLRAEHNRNQMLETQKYANQLKQQIEYNALLKKREQEELEKRLREGLEEEETFKHIVQTLLTENAMPGSTHPFRKVLNKGNCICPKSEHC